jgi:Domain of unknown function (DUF4145)
VWKNVRILKRILARLGCSGAVWCAMMHESQGAAMDGYQLVASLFQSFVSLAWPVALVISVLLFRDKLGPLLPFLRVKHKDWEASFRLEQAEKEAAALPPRPEQPEPTPEEKDRIEKLAEISPRAAILELRTELENIVRFLAQRYGSQTASPLTLAVATRVLRSKKIIDPHTSALLDDLRAIGNSAAHGTENQFTKEDAMRFKSLVDVVTAQLAKAELDYMMK